MVLLVALIVFGITTRMREARCVADSGAKDVLRKNSAADVRKNSVPLIQRAP